MESIKEININCQYCFLNDKINIRNFNSNLLKTDTKSYKNIDIYYIRYIVIKNIGDHGSIHSVNPFTLLLVK